LIEATAFTKVHVLLNGIVAAFAAEAPAEVKISAVAKVAPRDCHIRCSLGHARATRAGSVVQ
jgi:hypothetical protein